MPRKAKPARLVYRAEGDTWVIRDGRRYIRTGCPRGSYEAAVGELARYLAERQANAPGRGGRASAISVATVLRVYVNEHGPKLVQQETLTDTVRMLIPYWGSRMVSEINGRTCREYARAIGKPPSARRSLETLRAAVNHYHREYGLDPKPAVTLPAKPEPRTGWLTRAEAARLLRAARSAPHLARFILIGLYSGSRSASICGLRWMPSTAGGWIDAERGVMYRAAAGSRSTKKRQPPIRIPDRLLAHLRRWRRMDAADIPVVHYHGRPVGSIRKAFRSARAVAGLPATVVPHTLRHTSVTWAMQAGVDRWQACGFFGLTMQTLEQTYGHHHPEFQTDMNRAFT